MYKSIVQRRGPVTFPEFTGERIYMHEFRKSTGLPPEYARWRDTVEQMLTGIDTDGPIYLMVDQGVVAPGQTHRRPGVHIDGYWNPAMLAHGFTGGWGSSYVPPSHGYTPPSHGYIPPSPTPYSTPGLGISQKPKRPATIKKKEPEVIAPLPPLGIPHPKRKRKLDGWASATFDAPEGIVLASDVQGCEALIGRYSGDIGDGGDCSRIDLSGLHRIKMDASTAFAGNVCMLHQSLPLYAPTQRTLVRLNVPGWSPEL